MRQCKTKGKGKGEFNWTAAMKIQLYSYCVELIPTCPFAFLNSSVESANSIVISIITETSQQQQPSFFPVHYSILLFSLPHSVLLHNDL